MFSSVKTTPSSPSFWSFGNTPTTPNSTANHTPNSPPTSTSRLHIPSRAPLGYLAFSPGEPISKIFQSSYSQPPQSSSTNQRGEKGESDEQSKQEDIWKARMEQEALARQARLTRELDQARYGEEEWVRSGGILRDAEGRRDVKRTEAVREELRLREVERILTQKWEEYEHRWSELLSTCKGKKRVSPDDHRAIRFCDIPWPVDVDSGQEDLQLSDLTDARMEEFLLGNLRVRGCKVTRKERLRSSLLRWHPDKLTGVMSCVLDEDVDTVRQGINSVMVCLQQLNSHS